MRDLRVLYEPKENYYEPRKTKGAFGGNYIEYESNGDIDEVSSNEGYLDNIEPYLFDIINKHKGGWKIELAAGIPFSSVGDEDSKKYYPIYMHSKNLKVYNGSLTGMAVHDLLKSFLDDFLDFAGELECLRENTEKYISFSAKINKKITKKDENGNKNIVNIRHRLKFIDGYRFMAASLTELVDNVSNGLHSKKCTDCGLDLEYMIAKDDILIFRCFKCKKTRKIDFDKELSVYQFCKGDINKFILLLRKGVYPYEYMQSWNRFNEKSLPDKKYFYSRLNMENIIDVDYIHATRVFKEFEMNNLGDYHDLYVQSDPLLFADKF